MNSHVPNSIPVVNSISMACMDIYIYYTYVVSTRRMLIILGEREQAFRVAEVAESAILLICVV